MKILSFFQMLLASLISNFTPGAWCSEPASNALIKLGAFVEDVSGKIGGTIFSRNKGGAYAKNRVVPLNPQSPAQSGVRAIFTALSQNWRVLTNEQRAAWKNATDDYPYQNRLGEAKTLSGFALYKKLNQNLSVLGLAPIDVPLSPGQIAGLTDVTATYDIGLGNVFDVNATFETGFSGATSYAIYATESVSPGVSNVNSRYKLVTTTTGAALSAGVDIKADYEAIFGVGLENSKVGVKIRPINNLTGQSGVEVATLTTVIST